MMVRVAAVATVLAIGVSALVNWLNGGSAARGAVGVIVGALVVGLVLLAWERRPAPRRRVEVHALQPDDIYQVLYERKRRKQRGGEGDGSTG